MKPYAVSVKLGEKVSSKEFDTAEELKAFLAKAEELKKKAPHLLVKVTRNGLKKKAPEKTVGIIKDPRKEDSLCWVPIYKDGKPYTNYKGEQVYKCVPVTAKPKVFYCPYCNCYKNWEKIDFGYGLMVKGCGTCGVSEDDFYIKTANNLWRMNK